MPLGLQAFVESANFSFWLQLAVRGSYYYTTTTTEFNCVSKNILAIQMSSVVML